MISQSNLKNTFKKSRNYNAWCNFMCSHKILGTTKRYYFKDQIASEFQIITFSGQAFSRFIVTKVVAKNLTLQKEL